MQVEMLKTNMQVQTTYNLIDTLRNNISLTADAALRDTSANLLTAVEYEKAKRKAMISSNSKAAQIF